MKTETFFLVKARQDKTPLNPFARSHRSCLFTRNLHLIDLAEKILTKIKTRKQVSASEWRNLLKKFNATVSNYESCLQRLKAAGLVLREKGIPAFKRFLPFPIADSRDMAGVESILKDENEAKLSQGNLVKAMESWIEKLEEIERKLKLLRSGS